MKFSTRKQRQEFNGGLALIRTAGEAVRHRIRTGRRLVIEWFPAEKWKPAIHRNLGGKRGVL